MLVSLTLFLSVRQPYVGESSPVPFCEACC